MCCCLFCVCFVVVYVVFCLFRCSLLVSENDCFLGVVFSCRESVFVLGVNVLLFCFVCVWFCCVFLVFFLLV